MALLLGLYVVVGETFSRQCSSMRLILWKLHVWRIDYCLAGKEERFQLPKRSYQGGTQQCSLVCVMDYLMTLVTKARVALTGNTGSTYKSAQRVNDPCLPSQIDEG